MSLWRGEAWCAKGRMGEGDCDGGGGNKGAGGCEGEKKAMARTWQGARKTRAEGKGMGGRGQSKQTWQKCWTGRALMSWPVGEREAS